MGYRLYKVHALLLSVTLGTLSVACGAEPGPISQAEALLAEGKTQAVYDLLAPLEFEYSGDPKFDLMFGYAALESGNASVASLAFERVLALEPSNPEARLHLARAYVVLNDPASAKREFETLLAANPTQSIRATIGQYLGALQSVQPTEREVQTPGRRNHRRCRVIVRHRLQASRVEWHQQPVIARLCRRGTELRP